MTCQLSLNTDKPEAVVLGTVRWKGMALKTEDSTEGVNIARVHILMSKSITVLKLLSTNSWHINLYTISLSFITSLFRNLQFKNNNNNLLMIKSKDTWDDMLHWCTVMHVHWTTHHRWISTVTNPTRNQLQCFFFNGPHAFYQWLFCYIFTIYGNRSRNIFTDHFVDIQHVQVNTTQLEHT